MKEKVLHVAGAFFALALIAQPASAVTITDGNTYDITPGNLYNASVSVGSSSLPDTYSFTYTGLPVASLAFSVTNQNENGGQFIQSLTIDWLFNGVSLISGPQPVPSGANLNQQLFLPFVTAGSAIYELVVAATSVGPLGGVYTVSITTTEGGPTPTPLPGALVLLGSVLLGGLGFSKLRQRFA